MARKIMIVRHGEKPAGKNGIHGVDENGNHDDDELSVRGWQRAGALIRFFAPFNKAFTHAKLATPTVLYAPRPTRQIESVRSEHTLLPLAQYLSKSVDTRFKRDEVPKLAKAAIEAEGIVLIAWEHDHIPELAAAITGTQETFPDHWPDSRFDLVWILDQVSETAWNLTQVPQLVLAGDSSEIIAS